jgi:hypothetical protein
MYSALKAPLASPVLTGTATGITQGDGRNSVQCTSDAAKPVSNCYELL